jgi:hypothetical protein
LPLDLTEPALGLANLFREFSQPGTRDRVFVTRCDFLEEPLILAAEANQAPLQSMFFSLECRQLVLCLPGSLGQRFLEEFSVRAETLELLDHDPLDLSSRDRLRGAGLPAALLSPRTDVIAIMLVALARVRGGHGTVARPIAKKPLKE